MATTAAGRTSVKHSSNNDLVTGNVTGLNYFHGNVSEFNTNVGDFNPGNRGISGFTNISAPINYNQRSTGTPNYTPIFNQANYVGPTSNLTPTQNNVSYVPTQAPDPNTPSSDTRLQLQSLNPTSTDLPGGNLPTPGAADAPGPVNPVGNQSLYSMSPLYGVREIQPGDQTQDNLFMSRYGSVGRPGRTGAVQRAGDPAGPVGAARGRPQPQRRPGGHRQHRRARRSPKSPGTSSQVTGSTITGTTATGSTLSNQTVTGSTLTDQQVSATPGQPSSTPQQTLLIAPSQQSKQLAALEQRFHAKHSQADGGSGEQRAEPRTADDPPGRRDGKEGGAT